MSDFKMTKRNLVFADWFKIASKNTRKKFMDQLRHSIKQSGSSVTLAQGLSQITHMSTVRLEMLSDKHIKRTDSCETSEDVLQCDSYTKEIQQSKLDVDENSCSSERTVILENDREKRDLECLKDAIVIDDSESDKDCVEDAKCDKEIAAPNPYRKKRRRSSNRSLATTKSSEKEKEIDRIRNKIQSYTADESFKEKRSINFKKVTGINNKRNKNSKRLFRRFSRINEKYNDLFGSDSPTSSPDFLESRLSPELPMSDNETLDVTEKAELITTHNDGTIESHTYHSRIPSPYSQRSVAISIDEEGVFKICEVTETPHSDNLKTDEVESFNQSKRQKKSIHKNKLPEVSVSDYKITCSENTFIKTFKRKRSDLATDKHHGTSQNKLKRRHSAFVPDNAKRQMKTTTSLDIALRRVSHSVLDTGAWKIENLIADINHNNVLGRKTVDKIAKKLYPLSENKKTDIDSNSPSRKSFICSVNIEALDMGLLLKKWNCKSRDGKENVTVEEERSDVTSTSSEMGLVIGGSSEITDGTEDSKTVTASEIRTDVVEPSNESEGNNFEVGDREFIDTLAAEKIVGDKVLNIKNHYETIPPIAVSLNKSKEDDFKIGSSISAIEKTSISQVELDQKENVDKNVENDQNLCDSVVEPKEAVNETTTSIYKDTAYRPIKHTDRRYVKKHPGKIECSIKRKLGLNKNPISNPTLAAKAKKACDMPCIDDSEITKTTEPRELILDSPIPQSKNIAGNCEEPNSTSISDSRNKEGTDDYALRSTVKEHLENIHYILPHGVVISLDPKMLPATVSSILTPQTDTSEIQPSATHLIDLATPVVTSKFFNNTSSTKISTIKKSEVRPQIVCDSGASEVTQLCNEKISISPSETDSVKMTQPSNLLSHENLGAANVTQASGHVAPVPIDKAEPDTSKIQKNVTLPSSNIGESTQNSKENKFFINTENNGISNDIIFLKEETHGSTIQPRLSQLPTGGNENVSAEKPTGSIKVHDESYLRGTGPIFSRMKDIDSLAQKIVVLMRDMQFYKVKFMQAQKLFPALQERQKKICYDEYKVAIAPLEQECVQQLLDAEMLVLGRDPQFWRVLSEVTEAFIRETVFFTTFPTPLFHKVIKKLCHIRDYTLKMIESNNIQQNLATVQVAVYPTAVTANTQPIANIEPCTNYGNIYESHSAMPHSNSIEPCNDRDFNVPHETSEISSTIQSPQGATPAFSERYYRHNVQNRNSIYLQQQGYNPVPGQVTYNTLPTQKQKEPTARPNFLNLHQHQYLQNLASELSANQEQNFATTRIQQCLPNFQQESFTPTATCPEKTQASSVNKRESKKKKNAKSKKVTPPVNATMPAYATCSQQNNAAQNFGANLAEKLSAYRKNQYNVDEKSTGNPNDAVLARHHNMVSEPNTRTQSSILNTAQNHGHYLTGSGQERTMAQSLEQVDENRQDCRNITSSRHQGQNYNQNLAISLQKIGSTEAIRRPGEVNACTSGATNEGQTRYTQQPQLSKVDTLIQHRVYSQNNSSRSAQQKGSSNKNHNWSMNQSVVQQKAFSSNNPTATPVFSPNNNTAGVPKEISSNSRSIGIQQTAPSPNNHTVGTQQGLFSPNNRNSAMQQGFLLPNHTGGVQQGEFSPTNHHFSIQQVVGMQREGFTLNNQHDNTQQQQQPIVRAQTGGFSPNNHHWNMQQSLLSPNIQHGNENTMVGVQQRSLSQNNHINNVQQGFIRPSYHTVNAQHGGFSPNNSLARMERSVRNLNNGLVQCYGYTNCYNAIPPTQSPNSLNANPSIHTNLIDDEFATQLLRYHNAQVNGTIEIQRTDVPSHPSMRQDGMFSRAAPGREVPGSENNRQELNRNAMEFSQMTIQNGVMQLNQKNSEVVAKIISNSVERSSRDSGFISPPNRDNFQSPESSLTSP